MLFTMRSNFKFDSHARLDFKCEIVLVMHHGMPSHIYPTHEPIKTLKLSIVEASFYYVMFGFGEAYFSAYLIWMQANSFELALLMTLPILAGSILQMFTTQLVVWFGSRKRFIMAMATVQGICYLPLLLVAHSQYRVLLSIGIVVLYQIVFRIHVPAWNSLMGEHVHDAKRGEYFGFHKRISNIFILVSSVISGLVMFHYQADTQTVFTGFCVIFGVAFLGRMVSVSLLSKHYEVPVDFDRFVHFQFRRDIKLLRNKGLGRLILEYSLISFAQYVAIPFFAPYMLSILHFDYFQYGLLTAIVVGGRVLFSPTWGALSDRFGCRKVILITGYGIASLTLLWAFFDSFLVICFLQLLSGFFWSGFELAWFQVIMESTNAHNRTQAYTLQQIMGGVAMLLGSLFGGWIVSFDRGHAQVYIIVFFTSFVLRFLTVFLFGVVNDVPKHNHPILRGRDFAATFLRDFLDRGVFYVPDMLKKRK